MRNWASILAILICLKIFPLLTGAALTAFGIGYLAAKLFGMPAKEQTGCGYILAVLVVSVFVFFLCSGPPEEKSSEPAPNHAPADTTATKSSGWKQSTSYTSGYYDGADDGIFDGANDVDKEGRIRYRQTSYRKGKEELESESEEYRRGYEDGYDQAYMESQRQKQYHLFEEKREAAREQYEKDRQPRQIGRVPDIKYVEKPKILDQPNPYK